MTQAASKNQILLARVAVVLMVAFVGFGLAWHGVSAEALRRVWQNLVERPFGPMTFRFFLQPIMVSIAAWRDGARDARTGRSPYLWAILTNPAKLGDHLGEGLVATARIILLGLVMDVIYQAIVFETFHPGEAVIIAILLAFVPYLLLRGPAARVAGWWRGDRPANEAR